MGTLRQQLIETVEQSALDAVRSGVFDRTIEGIIVDTVRRGPDTGLSRVGFILKMAVELIDRSSPPLSFTDAKSRAALAYREFRRQNKVRFGDDGWDWSGGSARELAHAFEIDYWEAQP